MEEIGSLTWVALALLLLVFSPLVKAADSCEIPSICYHVGEGVYLCVFPGSEKEDPSEKDHHQQQIW